MQQHDNADEYGVLLQKQEKMVILAVDDDRAALLLLSTQLESLGYEVICAANGHDAINKLNERPGIIDIIIMDRNMPIMDGITAVRKIKDNPVLADIPIIMLTGADSSKEIQEGINFGVFYYLIKPVDQEMLESVLSAAAKEVKQVANLQSKFEKHKTSFNLIDTCKFRLKTLSDAGNLAAFIANLYPDPEKVMHGIEALLINAIEHGNLDIGYDKKTRLIEAGTWRAEVERTQQKPEHIEKEVVVTVSRKSDGVYLYIEDQGSGFNWKKYLTIDPSRAGDNHGRGIAQAKAMSFDKISFNGKGNKVAAFVSNVSDLKW